MKKTNCGMKPSPKKKVLKKGFNGLPSFLVCLTLALLALSLFACRPPKSGAPTIPRPQPGYTAWLEKQSMAAQADKLIAQVSQTERIWMYSGQGAPISALLQAAPQWLELSSLKLPGDPFFSRIERELPQILETGLQGLYLGPLGEDQAHWQLNEKIKLEGSGLPASLDLDPRLGDEKDFAHLEETVESAGLELGADLLQALSSLGPDFFLQARNAAGHGGLYAMLELPQNLWPELPKASSEWAGEPVSAAQLSALASAGLVPEALYRDRRPWGPKAGWAVTGEVLGIDGKLRRWLYRYEREPQYPVFLWQDPAGLARRIFSAAVIQQTGFWRIPLTGLRLSALMGLEPDDNSTQDPAKLHSKGASPGLEALNLLTDQIHRYGGWAMQADPLPLELVELVLAGNCDFCREDFTEELVLKAVKNEDANDLLALYSSWLKKDVDLRRLARGFNAWTRRDSEELSRTNTAAAKAQSFGEAFSLVLAWRLALPGLSFFAPEELGIGAAIARQKSEKELEREQNLKKLLHSRAKMGLAEGKLSKVFGGKSALGVLSTLPKNGFWLMGTNFVKTKERLSISLPQKCKRAFDAATERDLSGNLEDAGQKFLLPLDGYEARHVILYMD